MSEINDVVLILRKYMGYSCACEVAEEIDKLYRLKPKTLQQLREEAGLVHEEFNKDGEVIGRTYKIR